MSLIINDGTGKGYKAKVDIDNRLHTDSVNRTVSEQSIFKGNGYNISTGSITLTSDGESAVAYLEYTGNTALIIKELLVIPSDTTGGSGTATIKLLRNPTAGTIVSNATSVDTNANRDFSSSNSLSGSAYKGAEGHTNTGGTTFAVTTRTTFNAPIAFDAEVIVLRKGNSIGVTFTPPSSNTSQNVVVAITCYEADTAEID